MIYISLYILPRYRSDRSLYILNPAAKRKYMYQVFFLLALFMAGCKTPRLETETTIETHDQLEQETISSGDESDSTTITHQQVDSNTVVTTIIRRTIYENKTKQRSNSDSTKNEHELVKDSLTPELIKAVIKGFAVACIGGGLVVLGFLITVVILCIRATKGS